ncbi:MAG TPA: rod shape-determining protein RodA, partial [Gammaproteobacteria bacterium]|nr:rod shape-determining protein RodA [Gammaproteobacteria bacterium]
PPRPLETLVATILIVVPVFLVARQPDLGTALLIGSSGFAVLWLAGLRIRTTFYLILTASACAPLFWMLMKDYQRQRVLTLLNPESDPLGTGYHIIQSKIAIGSGGLYGKGWLNGTQSHLEFLPARSTDFIFAVFSEEFGLFGIIFLMAIYLFIIIRGMQIA